MAAVTAEKIGAEDARAWLASIGPDDAEWKRRVLAGEADPAEALIEAVGVVRACDLLGAGFPYVGGSMTPRARKALDDYRRGYVEVLRDG